MMLVGNVLFVHHLPFTDPAQLAQTLGTLFGPVVHYGVLYGMINAAVLGATAITLSSAWAWAEVRRWPHSLQLPLRQAPGFYGVYIVKTMAAAAFVLIPGMPLQFVIISVQVLAALVLPVALIFLQLLLNDRAMLGDAWVNRPWNNLINWTVIIVLFILSAILAVQVLLPGSHLGGF